MKISYQGLWDRIAATEKSVEAVFINADIDAETLEKLRNDVTVDLEVIIKLCHVLECDIADIVTIKAVQASTVEVGKPMTIPSKKLRVSDCLDEETATLKDHLIPSKEDLEKIYTNCFDQMIRDKLDSHFLYDVLSAIRALTKKNSDYAYDLIYDFVVYLRSCIRGLARKETPFMGELEAIESYLNLQLMYTGGRLKVIYEIEETDFTVVSLSLVLLVRLAVGYGIYHRGRQGGTVVIKSIRKDSGVEIEISDDGIGFQVDETLNPRSGNLLLIDAIFGLINGRGADVEIRSELGEGTKVKVYLPDRY